LPGSRKPWRIGRSTWWLPCPVGRNPLSSGGFRRGRGCDVGEAGLRTAHRVGTAGETGPGRDALRDSCSFSPPPVSAPCADAQIRYNTEEPVEVLGLDWIFDNLDPASLELRADPGRQERRCTQPPPIRESGASRRTGTTTKDGPTRTPREKETRMLVPQPRSGRPPCGEGRT